MRITTRLAAGNQRGFMSLPILPRPASEYATASGSLDEAKFRADLAHHPCIMLNSNDDAACLALALELLDRVRISTGKLMAKDSSFCRVDSPSENPNSAERRFNRGRVAFVRVDLRHSSGGFRATVSAANPMDCVGGAEEFARAFAQVFADNLVAIRDAFTEDGNKEPFALTDGEGCEGIFAEARERNDALILRERYRDCNRRREGFCSPCKFDCPLFEGGKCKWK